MTGSAQRSERKNGQRTRAEREQRPTWLMLIGAPGRPARLALCHREALCSGASTSCEAVSPTSFLPWFALVRVHQAHDTRRLRPPISPGPTSDVDPPSFSPDSLLHFHETDCLGLSASLLLRFPLSRILNDSADGPSSLRFINALSSSSSCSPQFLLR